MMWMDMMQASWSDLFQELYSATVAAILESSCIGSDLQNTRAFSFGSISKSECSSSFRGASKALVAFQLPTDRPVANY